jgi:tetratricopeptide (TPR) repeat protein
LYHGLGKPRQAERAYRNSLALFERVTPDESGSAAALSNLAALYLNYGYYSKAADLRTRLERLVKHCSAPVCEVIHLEVVLSALAHREKRYAQAESGYRQLLSRLENAPGRSPLIPVWVVRNDLAALCIERGRPAEAVRILSGAEKLAGEELKLHPVRVGIVQNLGLAHEKLGQLSTADALYERAWRLGEETFGPTHPLLAALLSERARLLRKLGRKGEARQLEQHAREIKVNSESDNLLNQTVDVESFSSQSRER